MKRLALCLALAASSVVAADLLAQTAPPAAAMPAPSTEAGGAQALYDRVRPSLVVVRYTYAAETGPREPTGAGVVVGADGLVMTPLAMFSPNIPDAQMKDFKIIVPKREGEHQELDAVFLGRDERSGVAFIRTVEKQSWPVIEFVDAKMSVGQRVASVGLLPKQAGYTPVYAEGLVGGLLRGATPAVVVMSGSVATIGAPVLDAQGRAIGFVNQQPEATTSAPVFDLGGRPIGVARVREDHPVLLDDDDAAMKQIAQPPHMFTPASDFLPSLSDLPSTDKPIALPWLGVDQMTGLGKDELEFFELGEQPVIEVGEVIADRPAAKAGLKRGDKIIKVNGEPLERGDVPEELPGILNRKIRWMKPGEVVTFSVLSEKGQPARDVKVTLEEQPARMNLAKRFFAEDLGFAARDLVFNDLYARKLKPETTGVLVAYVKPQSSAQSGGLQGNDMITELNGTPVTDVEQFQKAYQDLRQEKPTEPIKLVVLRQGNTQVIRIEPPQ